MRSLATTEELDELSSSLSIEDVALFLGSRNIPRSALDHLALGPVPGDRLDDCRACEALYDNDLLKRSRAAEVLWLWHTPVETVPGAVCGEGPRAFARCQVLYILARRELARRNLTWLTWPG